MNRLGLRARLLLLVPLLVLPCALRADSTQAARLRDILKKLQANLNHYDASVPSLICDEQVISSQSEPGTHDQSVAVDSIFRLRRTIDPNHTTTLIESREIKSVNGKPATSQALDAPTMLNGLFEGGLAVVSLAQADCMKYSLEPIDRNRQVDRYVVRFATVLVQETRAHCFFKEKSKGRVFIDPASMQVTHIEITTAHHTIVEADDDNSRVAGRRELAVDYAPVRLGNETFSMPSEISMRITSSGFRRITWSFRAVYRDYHRLEVTSRIVPGSEAPAP